MKKKRIKNRFKGSPLFMCKVLRWVPIVNLKIIITP